MHAAILPSNRRSCILDSYTIKTANGAESVEGRAEAIAHAKEISEKTWRPVGLERADGRIKMQFRRGSLETYRFDTHDRR